MMMTIFAKQEEMINHCFAVMRSILARKARFSRLTAIITIGCFIWSSIISTAVYALHDERQCPHIDIKSLFNNDILPASIGNVTSDTLGVSPQDLHCHPEAQYNIARILEILDTRYAIKKVQVEGAAGEVDI
jgi:hypothetical protein